MGVVLLRLRQLVTRAPRRVLYPLLGVGMAITTLVAGMERTSYLASSAGVAKAIATTSSVASTLASSTVRARPDGAPAAVTTGLNLDVGHARIDSWVRRLTTSLRGDFQLSLSRMDTYAVMITQKLHSR